MHNIFHITSHQQWSDAQRQGFYCGDTLESEGFIHCSTLVQLVGSANRFFKHQKVVILVIDGDCVQPQIKYEGEATDNLFPHIYGTLNLDAVVQVIDWAANENGSFVLPAALKN